MDSDQTTVRSNKLSIPEGFERFEKVNTRAASMTASIYKGNKLSLTKAVMDVLETSRIELLFSRQQNLIGIVPLNEPSDNSFELRKPKRQTSWNVGIAAFLRYYDLERYQGKKFKVRKEGSILVVVVDLNEVVK